MLKQQNNILLLETFKFTWQVELIFDSLELNRLQSMKVQLISIDWSELNDKLGFTEQDKNRIEQVFRKIFGASDAISLDNMPDQTFKKVVVRPSSQKIAKNKDSKKWYSFISSEDAEDDVETFKQSLGKKK
jgi:hypothetical protein